MNKIQLVVTLEYEGQLSTDDIKRIIAYNLPDPDLELLGISTMEEVDLDAHGDPDMSDMVYRHGEWIRAQTDSPN